MLVLTYEQQTVFDFIAEVQPVPAVLNVFRPFVAELMALGLVTCDQEGRWIITPQGNMLHGNTQNETLQ